MTQNSSATARQETPHSTNNLTNSTQRPISRTIKRRAQALIKSRQTDPDTRALIRYALETEDPWLPELVRRVDAGEDIMLDFSQSPDADDSSEDKLAVLAALETLAEMICRPGDEPFLKSAALLVLMAKLENAVHPKGLANAVKHFAFTHCGELNLCGMVDSQVAMIETKLLESETLENESLENTLPETKSLENELVENGLPGGGTPADSCGRGSGGPPFRRDTRQIKGIHSSVQD